jgi:excisionase family DNA binding protein
MVGRQYLSLEELSEYASLSVKTLRGYLKDPKHPLPHYKMPGKILIHRDEFDEWMQRYRSGVDENDDRLDRIVNDALKGIYSQPRTKR